MDPDLSTMKKMQMTRTKHKRSSSSLVLGWRGNFVLLRLGPVKRVMKVKAIMVHVILVSRDDHRNLRMVDHVVCHAACDSSANRAFTPTADNDIRCMFIVGKCDNCWSRISVYSLNTAFNLKKIIIIIAKKSTNNKRYDIFYRFISV